MRSTFQGKIVELKNTVYDVGIDKDTFTKTTCEVAKYVMSQYDDTAEFRIRLDWRELAPLTKPTLPDANTTPVEMELWKLAHKNYEKKVEVRNRNASHTYAIVLGQCSQAL
jgi:hypothetical protein